MDMESAKKVPLNRITHLSVHHKRFCNTEWEQ